MVKLIQRAARIRRAPIRRLAPVGLVALKQIPVALVKGDIHPATSEENGEKEELAQGGGVTHNVPIMKHRRGPSQSSAPVIQALTALLLCSVCATPAVGQEAGGIFDQTQTIAAKVGQLRGLAPKDRFQVGYKSREELREVVVTKIQEEYSQERLDSDGAMLIRLGMLPPGTDYGKLIVDLLSAQIAGFYDQKTDALYLVEGSDPATERVTIAHEIFHGIQDQHFDLDTVSPPEHGPMGRDHNDDYLLATTALVEGDATILMFDFTYAEMLPAGASLVDSPMFDSMIKPMLENLDPAAFGQAPGLADVPSWLGQSLIFPYLRGMTFVAALRKDRSWARANAAYRAPPRSTEHILHPEKYLADEAPVLVVVDKSAMAEAVSASTGRAWRPTFDNVLGEFQIGLWLEALGVDASPARSAASGWGGDRLIGLQDDEGTMLATLISTWDTEEDAIEFARTLEGAMSTRHPDLTAQTREGRHGRFICGQSNGHRVLIERWGNWVVWSEGLPAQSPVRPLRDTIWNTRQIAAY